MRVSFGAGVQSGPSYSVWRGREGFLEEVSLAGRPRGNDPACSEGQGWGQEELMVTLIREGRGWAGLDTEACVRQNPPYNHGHGAPQREGTGLALVSVLGRDLWANLRFF